MSPHPLPGPEACKPPNRKVELLACALCESKSQKHKLLGNEYGVVIR